MTTPAPDGTPAIRALLVDDEPLARRGMRQLLAAHADVQVVGECRDGREAVATLASLSPDLLFLDVQMPELDGFGVLRAAAEAMGAERLPVTVFLTAYEEFAVHAFEVEAADYLVKPVSEARFEAALRRVRRLLAQRRGESPREAIAPDVAPPRPRGVVIPTPRGHVVLAPDEIDWIAADDYYAAVHARGRRHLLREPMASLEERLDPSRFVRVHRAAIVNVARVREVRTVDGETTVVLHDGTRLPVSRRRRAALAQALRHA